MNHESKNLANLLAESAGVFMGVSVSVGLPITIPQAETAIRLAKRLVEEAERINSCRSTRREDLGAGAN